MRKVIFLTAITFASCERIFDVEQCCCDWNAANFEPEYNGYNVNQLYFTGSDMCNNELCIYY